MERRDVKEYVRAFQKLNNSFPESAPDKVLVPRDFYEKLVEYAESKNDLLGANTFLRDDVLTIRRVSVEAI